jgi:hypothetical protein
MSIKVMTRVWEHSQHGGGTLLVLLALADYANDHGVCWPDVATLATKARLTDRQVSNVLNDLIRAGDLAMVQGRGRGKHSAYAVLVGLTEEEQEKGKNFLRKNFGEIKTVKNDASKRGNLQQEKGKFDVFSDAGLPQQNAPNPDPIRHDPSENRQSVVKTEKFTNLDDLSRALFDLCLIDPDLKSHPLIGSLRKTYKALKEKGHTAEQVRGMFTDYWYSDANWMTRKAREKGYKPEPPKPDQVLTEWAKAEAAPRGKQSNGQRQPADLPLVIADPNHKQKLSSEESRRIIDQSRSKATGK